jgi:serine protease Do
MSQAKNRTVAFLMAGALLTLSAATLAADKQDNIGESRRNAIVRAIERAAPAVLSINVVEVRAQRVAPPLIRDFWDFFDMPAPRYRLRDREIESVGSGFMFDAAGHILTNYHVIEGADRIASVTLADGRSLEANLVGFDARTDLAVLKVDPADKKLPFVPFGDSGGLYAGEWVIAIGNPFGPLMGDPQPTVSVGVVSAVRRRLSQSVGDGERLYQNMIQTDAAINPGNSGGPLVNADGQAIGINTMIFSQSGGSVGLGFAIPIDRAKRVARELIAHGRRRDPWAGFKVEDIQSLRRDFLRQQGITRQAGCLVVNILKKCPAYEAGLRPGDIVVGIKGCPVQRSSDIDFAIWDCFVDDVISLEYERQGKQTLVEFPILEIDR